MAMVTEGNQRRVVGLKRTLLLPAAEDYKNMPVVEEKYQIRKEFVVFLYKSAFGAKEYVHKIVKDFAYTNVLDIQGTAFFICRSLDMGKISGIQDSLRLYVDMQEQF